jgi:HYR domain
MNRFQRGILPRRGVSAALLAATLALIASPTAAAERLLFVRGRTIMTSTLDSMMVLPAGDVVLAANLYMGFSHVGFLEDDVLVYDVVRGTFSTYRDSEYFQSGILETAGPLELFAHVPPSPVADSLFQYTAIHGATTLNAILDMKGAVVFFDLAFPPAGPPPPPDTTPPALNLPADFLVDSLSLNGTVVTYLVSASDDTDPAPTVSCEPSSGSLFPVGDSTVECSATDKSGNSSQGSFLVTVNLLPLAAIQDLTARARPGSVTLLWSPVPGAAGYAIYRRTAGQPLALVAHGYQTSYATYPDSGLVNGVAYFYDVRWVTAEGRESPSSNEASATPSLRAR